MLQEINPIQAYYKIANQHLETSYGLRNIIRSSKKVNNYSGLLTEYFVSVSQGIVFLIMTLEGFFNFGISGLPDDYRLQSSDGKVFDREQISWLDFNTKIRQIITIITGIDYYILHTEKYNKIVRINDLRNDLTHLKRVIKDNFTSYEDLNKRLIDFDPHEASEIVFHYVNLIKPNFLVEEA